MTLYLGDCIEVMVELPDASVDAVVTDPPYGLKFMGKAWDHGVPAEPFWREMLRVAKPGAYLLAFGGTRTVHRIATNIEDSGWIIRDLLMWIYASGFPKGKANLKPAHEPIVLARKPGPLQPLNIDQCRIGPALTDEEIARSGRSTGGYGGFGPVDWKRDKTIIRKKAQPADVGSLSQGERPVGEIASANPEGRWPSNVLLSDPELFDEPNPYVVGSGATTTVPGTYKRNVRPGHFDDSSYSLPVPEYVNAYGDSGGYSRFFIIPKADRAERERGLNEKRDHATRRSAERAPADSILARANVHPTVKPIDLMRHLVRLVTPVDGVMLDPFLGSGTTALAASEEGFRCIGIEREAEYLDIAVGRLMATPMGLGLDHAIAGRKRTWIPGANEDGKPRKGYPGAGQWGQWATELGKPDEEPAA